MENNVIYGIKGPVVTVKDADCFEMMEMVHVGEQNLVGEVIGITSDFTQFRYMKKQPVLNREMLLQVQAHL